MPQRKSVWSRDDRQAFGDGNRLRASSIPGQRWQGPDVDEWDDEDEVTALRVEG